MKKFFYRKSFWTMAGMISASAVLMVACPEKKNDNGAAAPPPIYCQPGQYCPPGGIYPPGVNQNGGYALASAVGSLDNNGSYLALTFSALGAVLPQGGVGGVSNYSGPVVASGEVYFAGTGACPGLIQGAHLPVVNTLQQGTWTNGSFGNLVLLAANGIQIRLPNNFLMSEYGSNPPIRIKNPVFVSAGGGPECIFTSL